MVEVGIGHRIVSGEKHATPLHGARDVIDENPLTLVVAAATAVLPAGWGLTGVVRARRTAADAG